MLQAADGRRTSASSWSCLERLKLHQLGKRCGLTTLFHEEQLAIRYACGHEFGEGPVGLFLATLLMLVPMSGSTLALPAHMLSEQELLSIHTYTIIFEIPLVYMVSGRG